MECKRLEDKLNSSVDNGLSEDEIRELKSHLASCPHCARALEDLKKTKAWLVRLDEIDPPAWFEQAIMQRIRADQEKKSIWQKLFHPLYIKLPVQALATAVVVIIAIQVFRAVEPEVKTTISPAPAPAPITEAQKKIEAPTAPAAVAEKKMPQGAPVQAVPSETRPARQERAQQLKKDAPLTTLSPGEALKSVAEPPARPATIPSKESLAGKSMPAPSPAADYAGLQSAHEPYEAKQAYGSRMEQAGAVAAKGKKEQEEIVPATKSYDAVGRKKAKASKPGPALLAQSAQSVLIIISPHAPDTALEDIMGLLKKFNAGNINASSATGLITADVPAEKLAEFSSQLARFGELRSVPAPSPVTGTVHISINVDSSGAKADEKAR